MDSTHQQKIIIFRGMAATGKTYLSDLLGQDIHMVVLRKDDIYDNLEESSLSLSLKNQIAYDVLARITQTNLDNRCNVILDLGLADRDHYLTFLSKLELEGISLHSFFCICSDQEVWQNRIASRIKNPLPNQLFKSPGEATAYYKAKNSTPIQKEIVIDSKNPVKENLKIIKERLLDEYLQ